MNFHHLVLFFIFLITKHSVFAQSSCNNPLLSISYNNWAPLTNSTLKPEECYNMEICSYLNNQIICCNSDVLSIYVNEWNLFKNYFNEINKEQLEIMASKVENAYANRDEIVSVYKSANSTLNSFYTNSDNIQNQQINQNLSSQIDNIGGFSIGNESLQDYGLNSDNLKKLLNDSLNLNLSEFENLNFTVSDYLDYNTNITDFLLQYSGLPSDQQDYIRSLDRLDEEGVNQEINNTQLRYQALVLERTSCYSGLFRHFASLMCLSCENDYSGNGIDIQNQKIHLNLSLETCQLVQRKCYGYLSQLVEMNKNAIFFSNTESLDSLDLANTNTSEFSSATGLYSFVVNRVNSLRDFLNQQILFTMPDNCTQGDCPWICENYLTSTGLNFEQILNGTLLSVDTLNQNINSILGARILQNSTINSSTINFSSFFTTNTYTKADLTNLNFTVDGSAGVKLFEKKTQIIVSNVNQSGKIEFKILSVCFVCWILFF